MDCIRELTGGCLINSDDKLMNLKKQLELFLKESGMTATELSRRSGVSRKTLQNWMSNQTPRNFDQVKAVCTVIGCSLDDLVFGSGFESKNQPKHPLDSDSWMSGVFEIKVRRIK